MSIANPRIGMSACYIDPKFMIKLIKEVEILHSKSFVFKACQIRRNETRESVKVISDSETVISYVFTISACIHIKSYLIITPFQNGLNYFSLNFFICIQHPIMKT